MAIDIPHACTLPTEDRPVRLAEFARLFATATSRVRNGSTHLTVFFDERPNLQALVSDLAARESSCCTFFDFTVETRAGQVVLDIRVNDAHSDILDALETLAGELA